MARVINLRDPGKLRHRARRTIAEILRRLTSKPTLDVEARDMAATVVFCLRDIAKTIEVTTTAWERRNYYLKADRFRLQWEWVTPTAENLCDLIIKERWKHLPGELAELASHFSDIRVARMTRDASTWQGNYQRLLAQKDEPAQEP
ncbi:MAG: hypothetical protein ACLFV5_07760 [Anaerolineales bacterium]